MNDELTNKQAKEILDMVFAEKKETLMDKIKRRLEKQKAKRAYLKHVKEKNELLKVVNPPQDDTDYGPQIELEGSIRNENIRAVCGCGWKSPTSGKNLIKIGNEAGKHRAETGHRLRGI